MQVSSDDHVCFMSSPHLPEFIERTTPISLRKAGQILRYEDEQLLCDHQGLHYFMLGVTRPQVTSIENVTSDDADQVVVQKNMSNGVVFVADPKNLGFRSFVLYALITTPLCNTTKPCSAVARLAQSKEGWPCTIHFKNNQMASIELASERQGFLAPGTCVGLYENADPGAKLLACGVVANIQALNAVFFKREHDKEAAQISALLERNKKLGF
ncbi:MAG: hypothetical protein HYV97_17810 [Bdellovibrio sp.]|nr:hypothetical protein [Bdellovibrio sp.]